MIFNEQNVSTVLIHHFMIIDSLMLSRTELETCCVLGRRDNRYTTALQITLQTIFQITPEKLPDT